MSTVDLSLAFMFGIIGSLHCAQMCGPLVLAGSLPMAGQPRLRQAEAHLAYNAGRVMTYSALGALAGAAGGAVGLVGRLAGIEQAAALAGGVLLLLTAAFMSGVLRGDSLARIGFFRPASLLSRSVATLVASKRPGAKVVMGLLLGFLPCGLVYAALVKAAATASPVTGALTMAAFGSGTSGALLGIGLFSASIGPLVGRWSTRLAAAAVAAMGLLLLWRAGMAGHAAHIVHSAGRMGAM